jgi:hypothetical protein
MLASPFLKTIKVHSNWITVNYLWKPEYHFIIQYAKPQTG